MLPDGPSDPKTRHSRLRAVWRTIRPYRREIAHRADPVPVPAAPVGDRSAHPPRAAPGVVGRVRPGGDRTGRRPAAMRRPGGRGDSARGSAWVPFPGRYRWAGADVQPGGDDRRRRAGQRRGFAGVVCRATGSAFHRRIGPGRAHRHADGGSGGGVCLARCGGLAGAAVAGPGGDLAAGAAWRATGKSRAGAGCAVHPLHRAGGGTLPGALAGRSVCRRPWSVGGTVEPADPGGDREGGAGTGA